MGFFFSIELVERNILYHLLKIFIFFLYFYVNTNNVNIPSWDILFPTRVDSKQQAFGMHIMTIFQFTHARLKSTH